MTGTELTEVRLGGRNLLRPGDPVKVRPSATGRRDGYVGKVLAIRDTPTGVEVDVSGGPANRAPSTRTLRLERLERTRKELTHR